MLKQYFYRAKQLLATFLLLVPLAVQAVDVQVSALTDMPDPAVRAGDLTYTISVSNASADTANNVVLTFPLPATTTFISVDNGACSHSGSPGTLTCNLGNITGDGIGGPVTTINTVIRTSAATGSTVGVTATVTTSSTDTNTSNNARTQNTTIDAGADLVTTISDSPDPATGAGNVTYTVSIQNQGPNDAATTTVTNTLPPEVTFISASGSGWSCGNSGQLVTCTRSGIANTITAPDLNIVARVTGASSGTITDSVTVSSTTGDPFVSNNTVTENTSINNGTDVSIGLSVSPTSVPAGSSANFFLAPRNTGPSVALASQVIYTLPVGFTFVSINSSGSWSCGESAGVITCDLASFGVGVVDNISITATAPASGSVNSTATISTTTTEPNTANNTATLSGAIVPAGADLSIAKDKSPNPVVEGTSITNTITVLNNGPDATTGTITVVDTLSAETFVSSSGTNWSCNATGTAPAETVTCTYSGAALSANDDAPLLVINTTARINAGTGSESISNTARVDDVGGTADGVPGNNQVTVSTLSIDATLGTDLSITKAATTPGADTNLTALENTITYTLTVTNTGNVITSGGGDDVYITDDIPNFTTGTGVAITSTNPRFTCTTGATVECRLTSGQVFAANDTETFVIEATRPFAAGSPHLNLARVSSSTFGDTNLTNNTSNTTSVTVAAVTLADVEMTGKTISPNPVNAGANATYVLSFRNNGAASADSVTIQDVFSPPAGRNYTVVSVVPSTGTCTPFNTGTNTLDCSIGTMAANQAESITLVVRPEWDVLNTGWSMSNTATISTTTNQGANTAVDFQTATLNVTPAEIDLLVNDTDITDPVSYTSTPGTFPGTLDNIIIYEVDITNRGPSRATDVSLQNIMAPKSGKTLTFLCDDASATSCTVGNSTCNNTNTAVTGPATLTLTCPQVATLDQNTGSPLIRYLFFRVDTAPDAGNDTHLNSSTISANEGESDSSNNTENEDTTIITPVALGITKAPSITSVNVEQSFDWNIVVFKDGSSDAPSSTLSDNLPAGMVLTGTPTTSQGSCTGTVNATTFTCNLGTVVHRAVSGTADANDIAITVPVKLTTFPTGGTTTNTASANSPSFGTVSDSGTVNVTNVALGITKAPSVATVNLNQPFNWNIVVFKNGPADVPATSLTDTLPAGMVLTGTPTTDQGSCTNLSTTAFTCNLGTVIHRAVSGTADTNDVAITVPVQITVMPAGGVTTNTATASATGFGVVSDSGTVNVIAPSTLSSVSGQVHDRGDLNSTYAGWTVEVYQNGVLVGTTITDATNGYSFAGLQPGAGYEIFFRHPESNAVFGVIDNITLTANTNLPNQNFPLDPSGVVYDSITRQPVPGSIVTISGPPGFDPDVHLIGGTGNVSQTVGSDGMYKYLLNPSAPAGVYSLTVTQPAGYIPPNSLNIPAPCDDGVNPALTVGPIPDPATIQSQVTAPSTAVPFHNPNACPALGASGTQYYLSFNLDGTSADILNNHIPLDPEGSGLSVLKTTPKTNVTRGELVPYTVRITNNLTRSIVGLRLRDQMPPGFKYVSNSATLDGVRSEPIVNGRELTWPAQNYAVGESHEVKLILVVGAGVGEGEYVNQAWGASSLTSARSTTIANATVRIIPDPTFDCSDLIGKVFDDKNTNGYQDEGEKGLPGIRVVTARGLNITTDSHGRYHVPCAAVPDEMRGSNFILKLDEQTLPSGYRVTTENPRVIRLTRGKLAKLNFGAAIHRVIRLDLNAKAFDQDSDQLVSSYEPHMHKLIETLGNQPSVLHVAYSADGESKLQVKQRLINFRKQLESKWGDCDCNYELILEERILWEPMTTRGSVSTRRTPK